MSLCFDLPSELTFCNAVATRDTLAAWVTTQTTDANDVLQISAQAVGEVDGAGLQVLAALSNSGVRWRIVNPSAPFSEACRVLGLTQWVESPSVPAQGIVS